MIERSIDCWFISWKKCHSWLGRRQVLSCQTSHKKFEASNQVFWQLKLSSKSLILAYYRCAIFMVCRRTSSESIWFSRLTDSINLMLVANISAYTAEKVQCLVREPIKILIDFLFSFRSSFALELFSFYIYLTFFDE